MFMYFMKFQGILRSLREFSNFIEFSWVSLHCGNPALFTELHSDGAWDFWPRRI